MVLVGGVLGFAAILLAVQAGATTGFDQAAVTAVTTWHVGPLDVVMRLASELGSERGLAFLTVLVIGVLIASGRPRAAVFMAVAFVAAEWASAILKAGVGRTRPALELRTALDLPEWFGLVWIAAAGVLLTVAWRTKWRGAALIAGLLSLIAPLVDWDLGARLLTPERDSFPSGHALQTMVLVASVVLVGWTQRRLRLLILIAAAFLLLVGISRVYLAVHYPTDVLGGWLAGAALVTGLSLIPPIDPRREAASGLPSPPARGGANRTAA